MSSLDSLVDRILPHLRSGALSARRLRQVIGRLHGYTDSQIDRALQKARREGLIEYSKAPGTARKLWRLVERKPAQKVGQAMATRRGGKTADQIAQVHQQGFADGQQHAFQAVADRLHKMADTLPDSPGLPRAIVKQIREWATEIESGAWAEEASDESP